MNWNPLKSLVKLKKKKWMQHNLLLPTWTVGRQFAKPVSDTNISPWREKYHKDNSILGLSFLKWRSREIFSLIKELAVWNCWISPENQITNGVIITEKLLQLASLPVAFSNVNKTCLQRGWKAYPLQNFFSTAKSSKLPKCSLIGEWLYK